MGTREEPDLRGGERALLLGWLEFHRQTLAMKCDGLDRAQLVAMAVPPSNLSLLGLVRHLTEMERIYLVHGIGGGPIEYVYAGENPEADFEEVATADPAAAFAAWDAERARADEVIAAVESLDAPGAGNNWPLRSNILKVLGEYARHNGHADLLRERLDGTTGE